MILEKYLLTESGLETGIVDHIEKFEPTSYLHMLPPNSFDLDRENGNIMILANLRNNYNVSSIYTSPCELLKGFVLPSEYSKQLMAERDSKGINYQLGIAFSNLTRGIKINKKHSIQFQNSIFKEFEQRFSKIYPTDSEILDYANDLQRLRDLNLDISEIFRHTKDYKFTIIGFILFEITHETLSEAGLNDFQINTILQELDPNQKVLWSMRGFSLPDRFPDHLKKYEKLIYNNIEKLKFEYFQDFLSKTTIEEVAWNLLIHKRFFAIEKYNKHFVRDQEIFSGGDDLEYRLQIIELYSMFKTRIVSETDRVLRSKNFSHQIILSYHKYSREEYLIPLATWSNQFVDLILREGDNLTIIDKVKLKYKGTI